MKNYTLCFYEYPGALNEIKQWENLKFDYIIKKEIWVDVYTRVYTIKLDKEKCNGYNEEILVCVAMTELNYKSKLIETLIAMLKTLNAEYYKTIIFGKVNVDWLNKINKIIVKLERKNG